jgi:CheY-like chemotaxis protein
MKENSTGQSDCKAMQQKSESESAGTVLLVDDEEIIRQLGIKILEKSGYNVILACDGAEAILAHRQNHNAIDITILDMSMPGMDGMQTMEKLREEFPKARVMISTGHSLEGDTDALLRKGFCDVLMKPYRAHELTGKVESAIKK